MHGGNGEGWRRGYKEGARSPHGVGRQMRGQTCETWMEGTRSHQILSNKRLENIFFNRPRA